MNWLSNRERSCKTQDSLQQFCRHVLFISQADVVLSIKVSTKAGIARQTDNEKTILTEMIIKTNTQRGTKNHRQIADEHTNAGKLGKRSRLKQTNEVKKTNGFTLFIQYSLEVSYFQQHH